jgi:hypothetical protein
MSLWTLVYNVCLLFCLHIEVEDITYHVDATPNAKADYHALSILSLGPRRGIWLYVQRDARPPVRY